MVDLPHRFVPTTSKLVSPARIIVQSGHGASITAVSFSPCMEYFASADADGWLRIWSLETLDVLGIYLLGFKCDSIAWDSLNAVVCRGGRNERRISFSDGEPSSVPEVSASDNVIRLLGAPEVRSDGDTVTIQYGEDEFVHEVAGLISCELEPCERYVVALSPSVIKVFSAYEGDVLLEMRPNENAQWRCLHINWRGDFFTAVQSDGSIWLGDAVKKSSDCLLHGGGDMTVATFGGEKYIIFGDERGNITVYDIEQRALLLRTPRRPVDFNAVYPASEKVGLVALRPESATAFFSQSGEILSAAPLPAALCASCPGMLFSEVLVACADNMLYRIKLDDNSIAKVCKYNREIDVLACCRDVVFMHHADGCAAVFENGSAETLAWKSKKTPLCLSVSDNGGTLAALFSDHIDLIGRAGKKDVLRVDLKGGAQIIFGKEKTAARLFVIMSDLRIMVVDTRTGECNELSRLDIDRARILSVAPAAKSFIYVLAAGEHGQLIVFKVGLNSGKSEIVLRVLAVGTQIYGASGGDDTVSLRNDASCLRIISGLKSFSVDDWSRSEPLQLF